MDLYIVGISGLGREVANLVLDIQDYHIAGFVDKDLDTLPEFLKIRNKEYSVFKESVFLQMAQKSPKRPAVVLGLGFPEIREKVANKYEEFCDFPNVIHPSALLSDTSIVLGQGNVITQNCIFTTSIHIGHFNFFNLAVTIGHNVLIGNYNVFNPGVAISGDVLIKDKNLFGVHSSVKQGIKIGSDNILGMGGVLLKDVEDSQTLVGVPAKSK